MSRLSHCRYPITDPKALEILQRSQANDPNVARELYEYFVSLLDDYGKTRLYPREVVPSAAAQGDRYSLRDQVIPPATAQGDWYSLQENILGAAEHLWRENFVQDEDKDHPDDDRIVRANARQRLLNERHGPKLAGSAITARAQIHRLDLLTRQAHQLLLLALEANFYRERATSNFNVYINFGGEQDTNEEKRKAFVGLIKEIYAKNIRAWKRDLRYVLGRRKLSQRFFNAPIGIAARFKTLSEEFGPDKVRPDELGWASYATVIGSEFRLLYFNALLQEKLDQRSLAGLISAGGLSVLWVLGGYGQRPGRFAKAVLAFIGVYTLAFYVNDTQRDATCLATTSQYSTTLDIQNPMTILQSLWEHLYLALTNLTSLGADPTPCGPFVQVLSATEPLFGYFFLAVLAMLLIEFLRER